MRGRGSWPPLLLAVVLFLAAFAWLRGRSTFLARERDTPAAAAIARAHGVPLADTLALGAMLDDAGAASLPVAWDAVVAAYARERSELGDPLAAVAAFGGPGEAGAARRAAPDAATAWQRFRARQAAAPGLRFLELRARYAGRGQSRD